MYVYGACLFFMSVDCAGVCENICCVVAVVKGSRFF